MNCYVINLDHAAERWKDFTQFFEPLGLNIIRVQAVDGKELTLPHPDYDERAYRLYHGKRTGKGTIGCFFSHIRALRQFLETNEETACICEDDVSARPELPAVLEELLSLKQHWDLVRLNCLRIPTHVPIRRLNLGYRLTVPVYWAGGTGAYLINRKAAERIISGSLPMYLPYDHAFEQNWRMDFTIMMVVPFPIVLNEHCHRSTIQSASPSKEKLPFLKRYILSPLLPYRGMMTCHRWRKQLGTALYYHLFPPTKLDS